MSKQEVSWVDIQRCAEELRHYQDALNRAESLASSCFVTGQDATPVLDVVLTTLKELAISAERERQSLIAAFKQ